MHTKENCKNKAPGPAFNSWYMDIFKLKMSTPPAGMTATVLQYEQSLLGFFLVYFCSKHNLA